MVVLAFVNQKGGSGKSKTVLGTAPELAALGRRVLAIDADPQRTLTNAMLGRGVDVPGTAEVLGVGGVPEEERALIDDVVVHAENFGVDVLGSSNNRLGMAESELTNDSTRVVDLNYAIAAIRTPYDYVLIDTPGNLGPLTMSAIMAASHIVVVLDSGTEAMEGFATLQGALKRAARVSEFEVLGVVSTRYKGQTALSRTVMQSAQDGTQYRLYATIRESVRVGEMNELRRPMKNIAPGSPPHLDFVNLATRIDELLAPATTAPEATVSA